MSFRIYEEKKICTIFYKYEKATMMMEFYSSFFYMD